MRTNISLTTLDALLRDYDGKQTAILDHIAEAYPADSALLLNLARLAEAGEAQKQVAAIALLKRYLARGAHFPKDLIGRLLDLRPSATQWQARLSLLQMLPKLPIPRKQADYLCDSLKHCLTDRNTFVRAWAFGGLHHLASLYPDYRPEVIRLLARVKRGSALRSRASSTTPIPWPHKRLVSRFNRPQRLNMRCIELLRASQWLLLADPPRIQRAALRGR